MFKNPLVVLGETLGYFLYWIIFASKSYERPFFFSLYSKKQIFLF